MENGTLNLYFSVRCIISCWIAIELIEIRWLVLKLIFLLKIVLVNSFAHFNLCNLNPLWKIVFICKKDKIECSCNFLLNQGPFKNSKWKNSFWQLCIRTRGLCNDFFGLFLFIDAKEDRYNVGPRNVWKKLKSRLQTTLILFG